MEKIIHAQVSNPRVSLFKQSRNDRAACTVVSCSASDRCGLYAKGQCCYLGGFLCSKRCPYGKTSTVYGYTKRARNYQKWIDEKREQYKEVLGSLTTYARKLSQIGAYIFLPYAHMDMNKSLPFLSHGGAFCTGQPFLETFTVETVLSIIDFKPQAMMGGEILTYQKEVVPKFLTHLSEEFPELHAQVVAQRPNLDAVRSNVGRQAYIHTVKIGAVFRHRKGTFKWDGDQLMSDDMDVLLPFVQYEAVEVRMRPKKNECVEITSDKQVCSTTRFKD